MIRVAEVPKECPSHMVCVCCDFRRIFDIPLRSMAPAIMPSTRLSLENVPTAFARVVMAFREESVFGVFREVAYLYFPSVKKAPKREKLIATADKKAVAGPWRVAQSGGRHACHGGDGNREHYVC